MHEQIAKLKQRIRRKPEWQQKIILATIEAIPRVKNNHDRDVILPGMVNLLLGPEKTMRSSTVYAAVEKIEMILSRYDHPAAVEACRLANEALGRG